MRESASKFVPLAVALAARALPFLYGFEHYGDAPVRIEIAERWARAPHLWHGFFETYQYGPLHLTLLGLLLRVLPDRFLAPRLLSLVCGLVSVWLIWRLANRVAGPTAALVAALGLSLSPLHIQASTTGASEAVFLALLLVAVDAVISGMLWWPALLLAAACLVRYDGLLYVGLIALFWLRERGLFRSALLFGLSLAPVAAWLWVNRAWTGDALKPIHYIDADHRALAAMGIRDLGPLRYRGYCLSYWPIAVLGIASPLLALAAMAGAFRSLWTRAEGYRLAALAWIPAAYFTFRGAVLADFRPMARFALVAATLSLPFAWGVLRPLGRAARVATFAALLATPLLLAGLSWNRNGTAAEWARPLSPIGSVPPGIADAARWLRANAGPDEVVLVEGVWDYLDIPLIFAAQLPEDRLLRQSWADDFNARLPRRRPQLAVLIYQGRLHDDPRASAGVSEASERFSFDGLAFCRKAAFVYASVYRRCP